MQFLIKAKKFRFSLRYRTTGKASAMLVKSITSAVLIREHDDVAILRLLVPENFKSVTRLNAKMNGM